MALAAVAWLLQPVANAQSDRELLEAVRSCQRVPDLSARIACYDRALPPVSESVDGDDLPAPRADRAESVTTIAEPERRLATTVQIVEVQMPSLTTTRFVAADGRVFVRESTTSVYRWPDTPFDVEIEFARFGTSMYLQFPQSGLRIRVTNRN
jgi:hypothetical protein